MRSLRFLIVPVAALSPDMALAHEAFGDLGPFYTHMLHPAVDPAQGLVLVGTGAVLARQPIDTVRAAYAMFAVAAALAVSVLAALPLAAPAVRLTAATAVILGILAAIGLQMPRWLTVVVCVAVATIAALSFDMSGNAMAIVQQAIGGAMGLAVSVLFAWGALDYAVRKLHPVAAAVAGSWIAAVGLLVLALPA